ncbi:hypothetical protein L204_101258 [Cryptococcus depauperatus]
MAEQTRPRRKVTSRVNTTPTSSPSISSSTYHPVTRAKVDLSDIATPIAIGRSPLKSTSSNSSLKSHLSTSTSISHARSPVPQNFSPRSYNQRATAQSSHLTTSTSPTRSDRSPGIASSTTRTPVARVRAAGSVIDRSGNSKTHSASRSEFDLQLDNPEVQNKKNTVDKASASSQIASRTRAHSLRSTLSGITDRSPIAHVKSNAKNATSPDLTASNRSCEGLGNSPLSLSKSNHSVNILGVDGAFSTSPQTPETSPERPPTQSQYPYLQPLALERMSSGESHIYSRQHLAHLIPHPTASAPTSPVPFTKLESGGVFTTLHARNGSRSRLPSHPLSKFPPPLPLPPTSPELRPIALPALTPARTSSEQSQSVSSQRLLSLSDGRDSDTGSEGQSNVSLATPSRYEHQNQGTKKVATNHSASPEESLSHFTQINEDLKTNYDKDQEVDDMLCADAEEAKIKRKNEDLSIYNASLLAINKRLEAAISKQRREILKLRRRLRETILHPPPHSLMTFSSSISPPSSSHPLSPSIDPLDPSDMGEDGTESHFDAEMLDPQLDARWENVTSLLNDMKERAEIAVEKGKEELKPGASRVLEWTEMEEQGEGEGDASVESIVETSVDHGMENDTNERPRLSL